MNTEDLAKVLRMLHDPSASDVGLWWNAAMNGHCDAFASALANVLTASSVPCEILLISRQRYDDDNEERESVAFSHVVVRALGGTWDIEGHRALERREEDWEAPQGFDDCFDYTVVTLEQLNAARREESGGRDISAKHRAAFERALAQAVVSVSPPSRLAKKGPRA